MLLLLLSEAPVGLNLCFDFEGCMVANMSHPDFVGLSFTIQQASRDL